MAASYPGSVYSPRTKENKAGVVYDENKKTIGYAEDVVKLDEEVVAIETYLGLPAGHAGKFLKVKGTEDGIEFSAIDAADKALSNLANVAVNVSIVPAADSAIDLGSSAKKWANIYTDLFLPPASANPTYSFDGDLDTGITNPSFNRMNFYAGGINHLTIGTSDVYVRRNLRPDIDSQRQLGLSTRYWILTYTDKLYLNATATIDGATAGHLQFVGDLVPKTDDTEWIGQLENPFKAIKGLIIKDTTDGKHYKVEVVNGVLTTTALD